MKTSDRDFTRYMRTWNVLMGVLGVSPLALVRDERGEIGFRVSFRRLIASAAIVGLSVAILYVQVSSRRFDSVNIGGYVISGYVNLTGTVVTCLNVLSAVANCGSYAELASAFLRFNACGPRPNLKPILASSVKFVAFFLAVLGVSSFVDFAILEEDGDLISVPFLLNYVFEFYNVLCVCHFAVCCFWLRAYLADIAKEMRRRVPIPGGGHRTGRVPVMSNLVAPRWVLNRCSLPRDPASEIRCLQQLYHHVYVLSRGVNGVFSTRNLLAVGHNFFMGTILTYCGLSEFSGFLHGRSTLNIPEILNYFKWSAICFVSIYGLVWPSNKIDYEVRNIAKLVQEYLTKVPEGDLQFELNSFVLQIAHERIEFSPHDFFRLNNRLLISIIGAAASYLIILIQFQVKID